MAATRSTTTKETEGEPKSDDGKGIRPATPSDLLAGARALLEEHDEPRPERVEAALWGIRHAQSALKEYGDGGS